MRRLVWLMACFFCVPCVTQAQEADHVALPEVVVTTTEEERIASTHNIVISQDTIKNSSAVTLNDLLVEQGVTVLQGPTPYSNTTTTLRGFSTGLHDSEANAHLLFLINGNRTGVTNARQLAVGNIERIEIIRGPEVYKYAGSSPGGVINIITKRGGPKAIGGSVEFGYGSYDNFTGMGGVNGEKNGFDYSMLYRYNNIKSDYKDGHGNTVDNSSTRDINAFSGNMGYTFAGKDRLGVEYYYNNIGAARRPYYYDPAEALMYGPSVAYRNTYMFHANYEGATQDDALSWFLNYGLTSDRYKTVSNPKNAHHMGQKVNTRQLRAGTKYTGEYVDVTAGGDFINYITYNSGTPKKQFGYPDGAPMHLGHTTKDYGLYFISTLKLFDNSLNITGGLRYDYWDVVDKEIGDEPFLDPSRRKGAWYDDFLRKGERPTKRHFNHVSPSLGISYLPLEWLKLRANYTQTFRAPSGRQLFSSDATEGYGAPGDPRLKPEVTDTYEIGFDVTQKHFNFSATYFQSEMWNHITIRGIQDPKKGKGPSAQNADRRRLAGIELAASVNLASLMDYDSFELRPYFGMTYMTQRKELMMKGFDGGTMSEAGDWMPITGTPKRTMSYGIRFQHYDWKLSANLNFNYFGRTWGGQNPSFIKKDNFHKYGSYNIANFTIQKQLVEFDNETNLTAKLAVNNIFDEAYAYEYDPPTSTPYAQGRNYYVGIEYNF